MSKILLSINPQYVDKILSGVKKYEYRTKVAKQDVDALVVYSTSPVKHVIGEATVIEVLELPPEALWERTKDYSGITKAFFDSYFKGRDIAYAYHLGEVTVYKEPLELSHYGIKAPPQFFVYLKC